MKDAQKKLSEISKLPQSLQQLAVAGILTEYFNKHDVLLTVVGGAAVQYYTEAAYVTGDLDAILEGDTREILESVMKELGFKRTTNYRHFEHPAFPNFVVEFPPEPIEVGNHYINIVNVIKFENYAVRVIKIEDIIMDRIIAGKEWKDKASVDQAKLLFLKNKSKIDRDYLVKFAKEDGYLKELNEIIHYVESQKK